MDLIKQLINLGFKDVTKEVMGYPANITTYSSIDTNTYYVFQRLYSRVVFGLFGSSFLEISFQYKEKCKLIGQLISYTDEEIKNITDNLNIMPDFERKMEIIKKINSDGKIEITPIFRFY